MLPLAASSALTTVTFSLRPDPNGGPPAPVVSTPGMAPMALADAAWPLARHPCPVRLLAVEAVPRARSGVLPTLRSAWRWIAQQARQVPGNVAATLIAGWVILTLTWIARVLARLW